MEFLHTIWKYLLISSPYILAGVFFAGILHSFIPMTKVKKILGKHSFSSVINASILGVPLPLCSCSVIPTAVTLKKSGATNAATSSFLISTPESGVDSIAVTYALMDLPMTIIRPIAAFLSAFLAGILQLYFNNENQIVADKEPVKSCCSSKKPAQDEAPKSFIQKLKGGAEYAFIDLMDDIAFWLALGVLAGATIDYFVPAHVLANFNGWSGRIAIVLIGIPMYICATASTPIAASLVMKGMMPGTALIFLLVGPATNISNLLVMQKYIGKKGVIINVFAIIGVALILAVFVDFLYVKYAWKSTLNLQMHHEETGGVLFQWTQIISAIAMVILLVKGIYKKEIVPKFKGEPANSCG
ncbi:MAG: SO_0444 family Cu/Zn efflux transporter [Bacteriovoracaceae bacterium]|nr:SO_0444 family Cu/Zn efflux transporter [Bacteriovoracaceae bacterium]